MSVSFNCKLSAIAVFFISLLTVNLFSADKKAENSVTVKFDIPDSYGLWDLDNSPSRNKGSREEVVTEGKHTLKGDFGWSLEFLLKDRNIIPQKINPGKFGRDLSGLFCYGPELTIPDPLGKRIIISIPLIKGSYSIDGLLQEGTGDRALFLPEGENIIKGKGWQIKLNISEQSNTAAFADEKAEHTQLSFYNNVVRWNTPAAASDEKLEDKLQIFSNRERQHYRSDEYMLISVVFTSSSIAKNILTISALQGEKENVILTQGWNILAGLNTRSFEIPLSILKSGKYKLQARVRDLTADKDLIILDSGDKRESLTNLVNINHKQDSSALSKQGYNGTFTGSAEFCKNNIEKISSGLDLYLVGEKQGAKKKDCLRAAVQCMGRAREYRAVESLMLNLSGSDSGSVEFNDKSMQQFSLQSSRIDLEAFVSLKSYLKDDSSFSKLKKFVFYDTAAAVDNDIIKLFQLRSKNNFFGCIFDAAYEQYVWASLILGARGAAGRGFFKPEFINSWKKYSGFLAAVMQEYYAIEKEPVFKVAENGNSAVFSFDKTKVSYRVIFTRQEGAVSLPLAMGKDFAYEFITSWIVPVPKRSMSVSVSVPQKSFRCFVLTENKPFAVRTSARITSTRKYPTALRCHALLLDNRNKRIPAVVPAEINIKTGNGDSVATLYRNFNNGILDIYYPLALNSQAGKYTVEVSAFDLIGQAEAEYVPALKSYLRRFRERTALEIEDKGSIRQFIEGNKEFTVVLGSIAYLQKAEQIKNHLTARRKSAEIKFLNEFLPGAFDENSIEKCIAKNDLPGNLILLGTAEDNMLIDSAANKLKLTPYQLSKEFPGRGKGLIQYTWKTFSSMHDAVIISGSDRVGVLSSATRFASGRGY
ncbi:MAG: hypothetical protein ACYTFY_06965 [Planctomycetota bacterium]|jgi:hypothetical protein